MNSVDTFQKRLRVEIAAVEKEIQSHNQQVESLTKRLEGLKRADELFESDQAAMAELLQTRIANESGTAREMETAPAATMQRAASLKATGAAKAARAPHSSWPRQNADRTRACEPKRWAHTG